ncbi:MAG TPA: GntR family transcriptional regulator, partial [Halomonas sp.]|nr:GntR family transcriptional regulator [Halomonas sp.]
AKAFMSRHLKAIEASLSMVEEEENVPDLQQIFGV